MKLILKKGAKVSMSSNGSMIDEIIDTDHSIEFDIIELESSGEYRWYKYKKPYPIYRTKKIKLIEWKICDDNEMIV